MSCQIKVSSKDSAPTKAPRSQTPPAPKTRMRRLFGRSQHQQGDIDRQTPSTNVATGSRVRRREGQGKGKARSGAWDCQPAGASTARAGAPSMPIGQPNTDKNIYPSPSALAGSERPSRRASRAFGCSPCGDSKYFPPHWKTLGEQRQKSSGTRPEQLVAEVKIKEENTVTETSQKIVVWINQCPKVTLCDIAQTFDAFCCGCGYVLPDVLKTKVVHCFKRDMKAGFQFESGCLRHNNHESEDGGLAKNRELFPRVQSEKSVCQSQRLTEHQRHLKGRTDAQMLSGRTAGCFLGNWTSESSAPRSAPLIRGKKAKTDRAVREDPGPRYYLTGVEISREKRMRLGDSVKGETLPSTPDVESISCKNPAKTDCREKEKTCVRASDDRHPYSEHAAGGSSTLSSAVKENGVNNKPCGEIDSPTRPNAAQMSSELLCETNDELESFTCQRVRVYFRKNHFSCARTYMTWPFSDSCWTLATHAATTSCPAEAVNPLDNSDSPLNQNQQGSPSNLTSDTPADPSSDKTHQVSHQDDRKREEDGESILAERSWKKRRGNMSLYSSESTNMEFAHHLMDTAESPARPPSDTAGLSSPSQHRGVPDSYLPINGPQTDSSMSTLSPSALGLSDWETTTTLSSMSSPFTHGGLSSFSATPSPLLPSSFLLRKVKSVELADASSLGCVVTAAEKTLLYCEDTQMTSCSSSSSAAPHNSDSFESCESSLLLPQDEQESDEEFLPDSCPPKLEPYYNTSPINHGHVTDGSCAEYEFMFLPVLSPVTSPKGCSQTSLLPQSPGCSDEEQEEAEINKGCKHKMFPGCHMPQIVKGINENSKDYLEHGIEEAEGVSTNFKPPTALWEPQSCPGSDKDAADGNEEESQDETDCEYEIEQGNTKSERVPSDPKIKSTLTSGVLTEPCSSPSNDEDDGGAFSDEGSSPSEITGSERDQTEEEDVCNTQQGILDEFTAYEQDILLVDVMQDDPELFENLTQQSLLKLGPSRVTGATKARPIGGVKTLLPRIDGASPELKQGSSPVIVDFHCNSPDSTEESNKRPWRPQYSSTLPKTQSNAWPATEKQTEDMDQSDANNNHVSEGMERNQSVETVPSPNNPIPPLTTAKNGPWITNQANIADLRRHKCTAYCRQYFSESLSCGFKMCRFQHVPVEGDEQFCVETVTRFTKNPMCLQKAGAVFTSYYHKNPPGAHFSMTMFLSLLWALLKAGMVSDVFSVLRVSLAHKIVPGHEFVLALFNLVREKALMGVVPELMQLTFKMANAGLVLSLDCLDSVKNTPEVQQTVHPNSLVSASGSHKLSTGAALPEYLNLAHAIVEIELCAKQEHWRRMGEVFRSICQSSQHPNHVEQISGRIAVALLSEGKDKLSLPFASFTETACQNEDKDNLIKSFLGRIGVSLMLRYHKTHQWAKGRRVVEVLSISKISYSTMKGLFGNENGASRCCLVTVAAELFLLSGSVEGALNTLRANEWFLSSSSWPCEPADVESRIRVLIRLAEKTCHRDTLYVLQNLPGIKEPNDLISISRYHHLFNSHLQVFMDRQALLVASDTVDFMLSNNLAVNQAVLQILLNKLGKQNLWLRAREVFRHSLSVGCYPAVSAPPGLMTLMVPCRLGEVELALAFEMFITVNATAIYRLAGMTTCCLSITLKRAQSCESEYLSAGSRLLSAACIPQPKLIIHYTAVNSSQEQVFRLDISSARCWLRHNHLWANEVWTH